MKPSYIKTTLKTVVNISKIVTVHYYEFDKTFSFEGEQHDFWEMVYIDKGSVMIKTENKETVLNQGEVIFHKPNEFHAIRAYESEPDFFVISFVSQSPTMSFFEGYRKKLDKNLHPFISSIIKEAESAFVIPKNDTNLKKLCKKADAPIGSEQLIKIYLEQLLIQLIRKSSAKMEFAVFPSKESLETHLITEIKDFVEENLEKRFKISDICQYTGYSKSFLCKIFKDQTGVTILEYITKRRIKRARQMIREKGMNFAQISDRLAFDNPQYFSRVFKRVTGITPTEFKETLTLL